MCTQGFRESIKDNRELNSKIDLKEVSQRINKTSIWYEPCSSEFQKCFDTTRADYTGDGKYTPCYI